MKLPRRFIVSFVPPRFPFLLSDYCFPDEHLKVRHLPPVTASFTSGCAGSSHEIERVVEC